MRVIELIEKLKNANPYSYVYITKDYEVMYNVENVYEDEEGDLIIGD